MYYLKIILVIAEGVQAHLYTYQYCCRVGENIRLPRLCLTGGGLG